MDRIVRLCEEIRAFDGRAERTGVIIELRGVKAGKRTCSSLTDLVRKYKLYGDGLFYLPAGHWPKGKAELTLDNVKWIGFASATVSDRETRRGRDSRRRTTRPD